VFLGLLFLQNFEVSEVLKTKGVTPTGRRLTGRGLLTAVLPPVGTGI
jgi:hypothetical protein